MSTTAELLNISDDSKSLKIQIYNIEDIKRIAAPIAREYGIGKLCLFGLMRVAKQGHKAI